VGKNEFLILKLMVHNVNSLVYRLVRSILAA